MFYAKISLGNLTMMKAYTNIHFREHFLTPDNLIRNRIAQVGNKNITWYKFPEMMLYIETHISVCSTTILNA